MAKGKLRQVSVHDLVEQNFPKNMRVTSGSTLIKKNRWKPTRKQWQRACNNTANELYIRIFGVDNQLRNKRPHKRTRSNTVTVNP